jgi:hypothetical protein
MGDEDTWAVEGYDTFEGGPDAFYPVKSGLATEEDAHIAAASYMKHLERSQPSATSGGQGLTGIQDRVYIVRPDGSRYRFLLT